MSECLQYWNITIYVQNVVNFFHPYCLNFLIFLNLHQPLIHKQHCGHFLVGEWQRISSYKTKVQFFILPILCEKGRSSLVVWLRMSTSPFGGREKSQSGCTCPSSVAYKAKTTILPMNYTGEDLTCRWFMWHKLF